ncbi:MAG: hypothetical protein GY866_38570 [Proteobacteria bacterium]|nr:hypothetical protein [Pseudomonadota bacterium]
MKPETETHLMDSLYRLKNNFSSSGIFLSFRGPISQDLMVQIGDILRHKMALDDVSPSTTLKVFSILVEQSQNIIRHSAERVPESDLGIEPMMFGIIAVGYKDGRYFVTGGNKIHNDKVDDLREMLTRLQNMDKEELKTLYKEKRRSASSPLDNRDGLGLIELARKASQPFEFEFSKIDADYSFYSLKTVI